MSIAVEIAVQDLAGLEVAAAAGADRVELCADLVRGGVTPPLDLIAACTQRAAEMAARGQARPHFDVHVLIRCRAELTDFLGHPEEFVFSAAEIESMTRQAADAVQAGAAGVVLGALTADARLDLSALEQMRDAALQAGQEQMRGVTLTLHRAVDTLPGRAQRQAAVEAVIPLGFHRVLSSGGAQCAMDGAGDLAAMVEASAGVVDVCAGGSVRPADIAGLVKATGISDVHLSARRRPGVQPAPGEPSTDTDPAVATAAVDAAGAL